MNFFVIILLWQNVPYLCTLFLVQGGKWTSPLASLHEKQRTGYAATTILKQRTQTHDMLPQQYYNVIFIFLTRNFS